MLKYRFVHNLFLVQLSFVGYQAKEFFQPLQQKQPRGETTGNRGRTNWHQFCEETVRDRNTL